MYYQLIKKIHLKYDYNFLLQYLVISPIFAT